MACIKCGKPVFEGRLCRECFFQEHGFVRSIKAFPIYHCRKCGKLGFQENKVFGLKQFLEMFPKRLKEAITVERNAKIKGITVRYDEEKLQDIFCKSIAVKALISGRLVEKQKKDVEQEYEIDIKKHAFVCKACSRQSSRYFEGILQLRDVDEEIVEFVRKDIGKNSSKGIAIVDEADAKNGIDLYLTDKKYIRKIAETLYERYGGEYKLNAQHFSLDKQTSKKIFRLNALFRPSPFRKGDVVSYEGALYTILSLSKNNLNANRILLISEKSLNLDRQEVEKVGEVKETRVVKVIPHIEVLHPETYDAVAVANPEYKKVKMGEKCTVAVVRKGSTAELWLCE